MTAYYEFTQHFLQLDNWILNTLLLAFMISYTWLPNLQYKTLQILSVNQHLPYRNSETAFI